MRHTDFLVYALALVPHVAKACWNVEVESFANTGKLTDYLTKEDEIIF